MTDAATTNADPNAAPGVSLPVFPIAGADPLPTLTRPTDPDAAATLQLPDGCVFPLVRVAVGEFVLSAECLQALESWCWDQHYAGAGHALQAAGADATHVVDLVEEGAHAAAAWTEDEARAIVDRLGDDAEVVAHARIVNGQTVHAMAQRLHEAAAALGRVF